MHFIMKKRELANALASVSHAISNFSPLPALSGIKIDVEMNGLVFTASNADISIQTTVIPNEENQLEIRQMGSIIIEAKYIVEIIRKLDQDIVNVESIDDVQVIITCGSSQIKINGTVASEYPAIDFSKPKFEFNMNPYDLKKAISQTSFAVSDKENRPVLTGVNFSCNGEELQVVATDSYRLAKKIIPLSQPSSFNVTIPQKSLVEINKLLSDDEEVNVAVDGQKIQFYLKNTLFQSRLIDGSYPDVSRLIPSTYDYELNINYNELSSAIDRALFIKNEGIAVITLSLSEEECVITNYSNIVGSSKQVLTSARYRGEPLVISFNGSFVFDALKAMNSSEITFKLCGEMKPFVIVSDEDDSILQLLLPLKTNRY